MSRTIDKRGLLQAQPYGYRVNKDGRIFITWHDKTVMIVKAAAAERMLVKLQSADDAGQQLILAKATGNFKHGNERSSDF